MRNDNLPPLIKKYANYILQNISSPQRYLGRELNTVYKKSYKVHIALSYPDVYEVGISNQGIKILYDLFNRYSDIFCEYVFAPYLDFKSFLEENNIPLYSLATYTPLYKFHIIAFNVSNELVYSTLLGMLKLGKVPIYSKDRDEDSPIVIVGGEAISNPLPLFPFVDFVYIGDG